MLRHLQASRRVGLVPRTDPPRHRHPRLAKRRERLLHTLEVADDPDGVLAQDVNRRLVQLAHDEDLKQTELRYLRGAPTPAQDGCTELIDYVGHITADQLRAAPEPTLRRLFDAMALTVHYDARDHVATCSAVVEDSSLAAVTGATVELDPANPPDKLGVYVARSAERSIDPQLRLGRKLQVTGSFVVERDKPGAKKHTLEPSDSASPNP